MCPTAIKERALQRDTATAARKKPILHVVQQTHTQSGGDGDDDDGVTSDENDDSSYTVDDTYPDVVLTSNSTSDSQAWVLDSGASRHCTNDVSVMYDITTLTPAVKIKTANSHTTYNKVGKIDIMIENKRHTLLDVALVPAFCMNLLSIKQMTKHGLHVNFNERAAVVKKKGRYLFSVPTVQNLWIVDGDTVHTTTNNNQHNYKCENSFVQNEASDDLMKQLKLLHARYGHVSSPCLRDMIMNDSVSGLDNLSSHKKHLHQLVKRMQSEVCDSCVRGKLKRHAMTGTINHNTTRIMHTWMVDIAGPIKHATIGGNTYVLVVVDVHSRRKWVFLVKKKSDAAEKIITLIKQQQVETGLSLVELHSDGGGEVVNNQMKAFLQSNGTKQTYTVPYTPQHNGIAERSIGAVFSTARTMLQHARAKLSLWGLAIHAAAHVLFRCIAAGDTKRTSYERWHGVKPDVSHLHVFGCDAYVYTHKHQRDNKFSSRAWLGIFVGHDDDNTSYYKIYNVETGVVVRTRDVRFVDNKFNAMKKLTGKNVSEDDATDESDCEWLNIPGPVQNTDADVQEPRGREEDDDDGSRSSTPASHNSTVTSSNTNNNSSTTNRRYPQRERNQPSRFTFDEHCHIVQQDEPASYDDAVNGNEAEQWESAIDEELQAHQKNKTWSIVDKQDHMHVIGHKWVFKKKRDVNGDVQKYKARLVAKGYSQEYGVDYDQVFAPTLKYKSLRIILALSTLTPDIRTEQLDVKTAFLNAPVKETIYVKPPVSLQVGANKVLKLNKALYGIKQAPHEWNACINECLQSMGFKACYKDPCVYVKQTKTNSKIVIGVFVDDITVTFSKRDTAEWHQYKNVMMSKYEMSELGEVNHILGMRVTRSSDNRVTIDQQTYLSEKLNEFHMNRCKEVDTPEVKDVKEKESELLNDDERKLYRQIVGSMIYAQVSTRPDIAHAVSTISRRMQQPTELDMLKAKRLLRYVAGTTNTGLVYTCNRVKNDNKNTVILTGYCDADWAGDKEERKSTTGYCVFLNGNLISWNCRKQPTVALSSAEAELMGVTELVKELKWTKMLLSDMGYTVHSAMTILSDSQPAIQMSENDTHHDRTKHIDTKHFFVRDEIRLGQIRMKWVSSNSQLADIFTKALGKQAFTRLRGSLVEPVQDQ